jgi:hypothetical protein
MADPANTNAAIWQSAEAVEATWDRVHDREDPEGAVRRRDRSPLEQARWDNHVRYIISLGPQLEYLRAAGFEGVDVYWRHLENVIYGGRRPAGRVSGMA